MIDSNLRVEGAIEVSHSVGNDLHVFSQAVGSFVDEDSLESDVEWDGGEGGPVVVPNAGVGEVAS